MKLPIWRFFYLSAPQPGKTGSIVDRDGGVKLAGLSRPTEDWISHMTPSPIASLAWSNLLGSRVFTDCDQDQKIRA